MVPVPRRRPRGPALGSPRTTGSSGQRADDGNPNRATIPVPPLQGLSGTTTHGETDGERIGGPIHDHLGGSVVSRVKGSRMSAEAFGTTGKGRRGSPHSQDNAHGGG